MQNVRAIYAARREANMMIAKQTDNVDPPRRADGDQHELSHFGDRLKLLTKLYIWVYVEMSSIKIYCVCEKSRGPRVLVLQGGPKIYSGHC